MCSFICFDKNNKCMINQTVGIYISTEIAHKNIDFLTIWQIYIYIYYVLIFNTHCNKYVAWHVR